jgi:hypothetical protein
MDCCRVQVRLVPPVGVEMVSVVKQVANATNTSPTAVVTETVLGLVVVVHEPSYLATNTGATGATEIPVTIALAVLMLVKLAVSERAAATELLAVFAAASAATSVRAAATLATAVLVPVSAAVSVRLAAEVNPAVIVELVVAGPTVVAETLAPAVLVVLTVTA